MSLRFETLATLSATHEYYDGPCRDLGYLLPSDTVIRLRAARILTRELDGVLYLLFEADEEGNPRVLPTEAVVRVGLSLLNPHFGNLTAPGPGLDGTTALYRNAEDPAELDEAAPVALVGTSLVHPLQRATRPVTVDLTDAEDEVVDTRTLEVGGGETVAFDLTNHPAGPLTAVERYPGNVTRKAAYYLDPQLAAAGVFGIVEIALDEDFYDGAPAFVIPFAARQEPLKYYVVATRYTDGEANALTLKDEGFTADGRPEVKFTRVPPSAFTAGEIPADTLGRGGGRVILFRSQADVSRRARPRRKLELRRQNTVLIENLPPPGADRATADVIVHVSKP
jgi:hypothetical protein